MLCTDALPFNRAQHLEELRRASTGDYRLLEAAPPPPPPVAVPLQFGSREFYLFITSRRLPCLCMFDNTLGSPLPVLAFNPGSNLLLISVWPRGRYLDSGYSRLCLNHVEL